MLNQEKKWNVCATRSQMTANDAAKTLAEELELCLPTAELLCLRGYDTPEKARAFLNKSTELLHDPFLMKDMREASERILEAVHKQEKIVIYGDYDVDGVTSVSSLVLYLRKIGALVDYYIPCRLGEGYGVSEKSLARIAENGCRLLVTVDTGITAVAETLYAKSLGMDVVVTDHHECPDVLPEACALVNPRRKDCAYPFKELAGVGVVFKLLCALEMLRSPGDSLVNCVMRISNDYGDLIAIGTIADVMPITDENRLIVARGLQLIESSSRPGIIELLNASSGESKGTRRITSGFVGYTLAPRINAAGRIREASVAVELFLSDTCEKAEPIAKMLCDINKERQNQENEIVAAIRDEYADSSVLTSDPVIVLSGEDWHHGIIGIVASRITERYSRPSIMISFEKTGGVAPEQREPISDEDLGKGSCRGVPGMHLVEALTACSDLLEKFGGHELAAGLTIKRKNLPEFCRRINAFAAEKLAEAPGETVLTADLELAMSDITLEQATELYMLEPFGVSNPSPLFVLKNALIRELTPVGGGKHLRLSVGNDRTGVTAMCFRTTMDELDMYPGEVADVMFSLDVNEFQGVRSVQMIVKAIRPVPETAAEEKRQAEAYNAIRTYLSGENADISFDLAEFTPSREDFVNVYRKIRSEIRLTHTVYSLRALAHLLRTSGCSIGLCRLQIVLDVLRELSHLIVEDISTESTIVYRFNMPKSEQKAELSSSHILTKLQLAAAREKN